MRQPITRPLPPTALRVLDVTADAWGLYMCAPLPSIRTRAARVARAAPRGAQHANGFASLAVLAG